MSETKNENSNLALKAKFCGSEVLLKTLINQGVDVVFGYPGGTIMPVYDTLFDYYNEIKHILTRHEQGAIHAAQGYARTTGKTGVVFVTSGPGATNLATGLADAFADSTPLVCISGQVNSNLIGSDAFQESDVVGVTLPITKWNCRLTDVRELQDVITKAFVIASTGRPGPVMIDVAKNAFVDKTVLKNNYSISSKEKSKVHIDPRKVNLAAELIRSSHRPFVIFGQGVSLAHAEKDLELFLEKTGIPSAWTILGKSALLSNHPLNMGMVGMHGNYAVNKMIADCDLLIALGMRFDDRVTGKPENFAPNAKIIHLDIDPSEIDKIKDTVVSLVGDLKTTLPALTKTVKTRMHTWHKMFAKEGQEEKFKISKKYFNRKDKEIFMYDVIQELNKITKGNAVIATDVGQHQMMVSRYAEINEKGLMITSGGIGTMGFGLPAAIGAKIGCIDKKVIAIVGDGGAQMTIQELGTIMQENLDVKIIILNNSFLGMVRQWQELFFDRRYSFTEMKNPSFTTLAEAYGVENNKVEVIADLKPALKEMYKSKGPYLLEVKVTSEENVYPMIPSGMNAKDTILE